jgi:hypothetical protein
MYREPPLVGVSIGPPQWKMYRGKDGEPLAGIGYSNKVPAALVIQQECERIGCAAFSIVTGMVWFHKYIVDAPMRWREAKNRATVLWVNHAAATPEAEYDMVAPGTLSPIGCSRHRRSCWGTMNHTGTAPCCTAVMKEIMEELSRTLRRHGIHWRVSSGAQLSIIRDGQLQFFDHDFDPVFENGKENEALGVIADEMHLGGKASKWRDSRFYYTRRVARRLNTDWSKYHVVGGDYTWDNEKFHDEWALQRGLTFIDVGDAKGVSPTKQNTMLCHPELDVLCLRDWYAEAKHTGEQGGDDMNRVPSNLYRNGPQMEYAGYEEQILRPGRRRGGSLLLHEDGTPKNAEERAQDVLKMLRRFPNYWETGNTVDAGPVNNNII